MKLLYEILAWATFSLVIGVLSVWPRYEIVEKDKSVVTITFSHAAKRVGECRQLSQDELNKLPPNMRKPSDCPRERFPTRLELRSGDVVMYSDVLPPSGIWSDGKANVYSRVAVPAGVHDLFIGMDDSGGDDGFDYEYKERINIAPGRNLVVQFDTELQQFTIR